MENLLTLADQHKACGDMWFQLLIAEYQWYQQTTPVN